MRSRRINWRNPITQGLAFVYRPGFLIDLVSGSPATQAGTVTRQGGSIYLTGVAGSGLTLGSGALLGGLANSTVVAVAACAGLSKALYSERASSGNDIYKLETAPSGGTQFTYRNDGATLLQLATPNAYITEGTTRLFALTKSGTAHSVYCGPVRNQATNLGAQPQSASGTFGSSSTAFTNSGIVRSIGYDVADSNASVSGREDLVMGWKRTLSAAEIDSLRANPEQILLPEPDSTEMVAFALHATAVAKSYTLTAATGSFALTGQAAGLRASRMMAIIAGAYTTTGAPAGLLAQRRLTASSGMLSIVGSPASITAARRIAVDAGSFTLAGASGQILANRRINTVTGQFALTGSLAGLYANRYLLGAPSAVALTGSAVSLLVARTIKATPIAYSVSGGAAGLRASRRLSATTGAFLLSGSSINMVYAPAPRADGATYTLTAASGSFGLVGASAMLTARRMMTATSGSFALSGNAAGLPVARRLRITSAAFAITGSDAALRVWRRLPTQTGGFGLAGSDVRLSYSAQINYARAPAGSGYAPQSPYNETRPAVTSAPRLPATQRNYR